MLVKGSQIILIVLVVAAIIGAVWFWFFKTDSSQIQTEEAPSLGSEIFDKTQNQLEGQVPDANPFKDQKNPLDTIYQNPFK